MASLVVSSRMNLSLAAPLIFRSQRSAITTISTTVGSEALNIAPTCCDVSTSLQRGRWRVLALGLGLAIRSWQPIHLCSFVAPSLNKWLEIICCSPLHKCDNGCRLLAVEISSLRNVGRLLSCCVGDVQVWSRPCK